MPLVVIVLLLCSSVTAFCIALTLWEYPVVAIIGLQMLLFSLAGMIQPSFFMFWPVLIVGLAALVISRLLLSTRRHVVFVVLASSLWTMAFTAVLIMIGIVGGGSGAAPFSLFRTLSTLSILPAAFALAWAGHVVFTLRHHGSPVIIQVAPIEIVTSCCSTSEEASSETDIVAIDVQSSSTVDEATAELIAMESSTQNADEVKDEQPSDAQRVPPRTN